MKPRGPQTGDSAAVIGICNGDTGAKLSPIGNPLGNWHSGPRLDMGYGGGGIF